MFCICLILLILSDRYFAEVLEHFSHSYSHLILTHVFAFFDCLCFSWRNFSGNFLVIGLNGGLKLPWEFLSVYLSQEILIFSCKVLFQEKDGSFLFSVAFSIFELATCREEAIFRFLSWKSSFVHKNRK